MEFKKILVTTDFSEFSLYAVPYAVEMARKFGAELILGHVIEPIIGPADFAWGSYNVAEIEAKSREYALENLEKVRKEHFPHDLQSSTWLGYGNPFKEVISYVKEEMCDLIVISTHGLTGLSHIIFGSTTEKIVRKSPVPVLTVRDPKHTFEMP